MFKKFSKLAAVSGLALMALAAEQAHAGFADLVATKLTIRRQLDDDVGRPSYSQVVVVKVRNRGNDRIRALNGLIRLNNRTYRARIYGSRSQGGRAGATILAGGTAYLRISVRDNTFRNCQRVRVHIDSNRRLQFSTIGGDVFRNDRKTMTAINPRARRRCAPSGGVIIRGSFGSSRSIEQ